MELDGFLRRAVDVGASDLHLKEGAPPVARIDGRLEALTGFVPLQTRDLETALRALTSSDHDGLASARELEVAYQPTGLPRFRVNVFRQRGMLSFAFRVIPAHVPSLDELGLPPGVKRLADEHHGFILVTGATGSGKTTTLAAMVDHMNRSRKQHIVTIEDPIEIVHRDHDCIVSQREIGLDTQSFNEALRMALRQDPDIILIGELRDNETAQTALHAAESGHLVLSTMHTTDAAETIGRLIEFFPPGKQQQVRSILAGVLRGVVSQRLLPAIGSGRVAAVEVMVTNARIADLIRDDRPDQIPQAIAKGTFFQMQTFTQALIDLVVAGRVDREIAASAATNRHDFDIALEHALKRHAAGLSRHDDDVPAEDDGPRTRELRPHLAEARAGER